MKALHLRLGWVNVLLTFCLVVAYFKLHYVVFWFASVGVSAMVLFLLGLLLVLAMVFAVVWHFINAIRYWRNGEALERVENIILAAGVVNMLLLLLIFVRILIGK